MDGLPGLPRPITGFFFWRFFLAADNPKHNPECEGRSGQRRDGARGGLVEMEDDESANQCKQRNQHDRAHLGVGLEFFERDDA